MPSGPSTAKYAHLVADLTCSQTQALPSWRQHVSSTNGWATCLLEMLEDRSSREILQCPSAGSGLQAWAVFGPSLMAIALQQKAHASFSENDPVITQSKRQVRYTLHIQSGSFLQQKFSMSISGGLDAWRDDTMQHH